MRKPETPEPNEDAPAKAPRINRERRAEIGAERRARSRKAIFLAAFKLFGAENGSSTRIEDICREAGVARGTFYNHFEDFDDLKYELLEELTGEFDRAVHVMFGQLENKVEEASVALRYYLHAASKNPQWGWAMINSGNKEQVFGKTVWENSHQTLQEGMDAGFFRLRSAHAGRDILMGVIMTAMMSIVRGAAEPDYPEEITAHVLMALGLKEEEAKAYAWRPLPKLPAVGHDMIVIASMPELGGES